MLLADLQSFGGQVISVMFLFVVLWTWIIKKFLNGGTVLGKATKDAATKKGLDLIAKWLK